MTRRKATARPEEFHSQHGESEAMEAALRGLPSVDALVRAAQAQGIDQISTVSHEALVDTARAVIAEARERLRAGASNATIADLAGRLGTRLAERQAPRLRPVINATGVIINTNLGRAPLAEEAIAAMASVARGYSNLEYDLSAGERGSRHVHVRELLRSLTGAEDALVVNNNAAAVLVVLSALASERDVIVSRGELVEIGGGFRVPDVMRQGGARLVEVGTTNRTRVADYEAAITPDTAVILAVHPSNFRVIGFTEAPELAELARVAHAHGAPLVHDLGSGCMLDTERFGVAHEPTPRESIQAGADVVCFSGDKLLGGPQAGVIAGKALLLSTIARHPLMRAVRIDKLTLAALEATLRLYRDGAALRSVPVWQAITKPLNVVNERATQWANFLTNLGVTARVEAGESSIGGGSLPGETLPTVVCVIEGFTGARSDVTFDAAEVARRLRAGQPPAVCRLYRGKLYLDPRTVLPDEDPMLLVALSRALMRA